jgi:hypothetical protein
MYEAILEARAALLFKGKTDEIGYLLTGAASLFGGVVACAE